MTTAVDTILTAMQGERTHTPRGVIEQDLVAGRHAAGCATGGGAAVVFGIDDVRQCAPPHVVLFIFNVRVQILDFHCYLCRSSNRCNHITQ